MLLRRSIAVSIWGISVLSSCNDAQVTQKVVLKEFGLLEVRTIDLVSDFELVSLSLTPFKCCHNRLSASRYYPIQV